MLPERPGNLLKQPADQKIASPGLRVILKIGVMNDWLKSLKNKKTKTKNVYQKLSRMLAFDWRKQISFNLVKNKIKKIYQEEFQRQMIIEK